LLPAVDWVQPWYAPWREAGEAPASAIALGTAPHEALNAAAPAVRFVPQEALPAGTPYEQFIFVTRQCPVRPGLHDFFNALVWLEFPRTKAALNRLQAQEIARNGIGAQRGRVRDAITVFDENGALLQAPAPIWRALEARAWRELFVELRPLWRQARLLVFGHALLEQLAVPRKGLTAHVWRADAAMDSIAAADAWLADRCTAEVLATKPFTPLPVLGVPGWWPENENFSFYDDSLVFRPRKSTQPITTTSAGAPLP
jgi:Protein of unknown function (DUF3025)